MATETFYRGISELDATAAGAGGAMLIANDKQLRDGWFALDEDTHWDDQAASTSTITMNADLTAWLKPGVPVKFKLSGTTYYGILTAVAAGLLTIAGAPLTTGDGDLEELYVGSPSKVHVVKFHVAGEYGDGAVATLLATDAKAPFEWELPPAYLVKFRAYSDTDGDTTDPIVNVMVAGSAVSTSNTNDGLEMTAAQTWYSTVVDISTTNYSIAYDESVEISTTAGAGADDLTVICVFVEE